MNNIDKSPEIKTDNHDRKKGGFLGKPGTFSRKVNVGLLVIIIPLFCFSVWVFHNTNKSMQLREIKVLAEKNLRSVLTSCERYWENNPTNPCSLPTSRQQQLDWGLNPSKVEVAIINGQKDRLIATAKHYESDKIFQIDNNGNTYIKINDCLLKSSFEWIEVSNEELEKECEKQKLMEEIQKAKLAVVQFLRHIGADLPETFIATLPDSILEYDEVSGDFWEFRTPYGRFKVTRQNPAISRFSRQDSIPGERTRPSRPGGYPEDEALEVAKVLVRSLIPNFDGRNFVLKISHDVESYRFRWREYPRGEIISVPPNHVSVILDRARLRLRRYSAFDYHCWRTKPPGISENQAKEEAEKMWRGKGTAREAMLWERVRKGGKEVRTVWTVGVALPNPEGEALEEVVIDADTGEVVEN